MDLYLNQIVEITPELQDCVLAYLADIIGDNHWNRTAEDLSYYVSSVKKLVRLLIQLFYTY